MDGMDATLPAETAMGTVTLTSTAAAALAGFYESVVGLEPLEEDGPGIALGRADTHRPLLRILDAPDAPAARGVNGLFHLAVLVPDRADLGHAVRRVAEGGWPLTGASDHFVSEAVYLRDPEGNGVEIYRDRPRGEWGWKDGLVDMGTVPLDLQAVVDSAEEPETRPHVGRGTSIGHVHLSTSPLPRVEAFYRDVVGFDVTAHYANQASFLAAGGYHHHLGANLWGGTGLVAPPDGVAGLASFEIVVPGAAARTALAERAAAVDALVAQSADAVELRDPAGLRALVVG
jgi:catechol 2,3-dioxygenase